MWLPCSKEKEDENENGESAAGPVCLSSPCLLAPGASHEKSGDLPESPGNKPLHSHCCPVPLSLFSSGFENPENFKVHVFHPIREV